MKKLHAYLLFPALLLFSACSSNTSQSVNQPTGISASSTPSVVPSTPAPPPDPWESAKLIGSITYAPDGNKIDTDSILQIKFSPNGTLIASKVLEDKIRIWDLQTGERKFTIRKGSQRDPKQKAYSIALSNDLIRNISFDYDSNYIIFSILGPLISSDGRICIVEIASPATQEGETLASCFFKSTGWEIGNGLLWSENPITIISGGWAKKISAWQLEGNQINDKSKFKELYKTKEYGDLPSMANNTSPQGIVSELSRSPDKTMFIAAMVQSPAVVFDIKTGAEIVRFGTASDNISTAKLRNDIAVLGTESGQVSVWSVANGKALKTIPAHQDKINSVLVSPDGKYIFSGSSDKTLKVWNLKSGNLITTFTDCNSSVNTLDMTQDGKILGAGCGNGSIQLWRIDK